MMQAYGPSNAWEILLRWTLTTSLADGHPFSVALPLFLIAPLHHIRTQAQDSIGMTYWSHWEGTKTVIWSCRALGSLWIIALARWWAYQERCLSMKSPILKAIEYAMRTSWGTMCMNGRTFWLVIGCIPNIMSRIECNTGPDMFFLMQHFLERNREMLQNINNLAYELYEYLSCQNSMHGRTNIPASEWMLAKYCK